MAGSLEPGRKRQHRQGDDAQETRETAGGSESFPASAVRDPGAPCWQRLEGSRSPDTRGARGPSSSTTQLTGSPLPTLPRPSLRAASGQWLGVVRGGGDVPGQRFRGQARTRVWPQEGESRTGWHNGRKHSGRGEVPLGRGRGQTRVRIILGRREIGVGVQLPDLKVTFSEGLGARRDLREKEGVFWRLHGGAGGTTPGGGAGLAGPRGSALESALDSVPVLWLPWGPPSICTCISSSVKQGLEQFLPPGL